MVTANVGDSRAVLVSRDEASKEENALRVDPLSIDHKPTRMQERQRLEASAAVLMTEKQVRGVGDDEKMYICREKDGEIIYG